MSVKLGDLLLGRSSGGKEWGYDITRFCDVEKTNIKSICINHEICTDMIQLLIYDDTGRIILFDFVEKIENRDFIDQALDYARNEIGKMRALVHTFYLVEEDE